MTDCVRFQKNRVGDVRSHKKGENTQKNSLLPQFKVENNKKKHVGAVVRLLWRAAAQGLRPLRLPHALLPEHNQSFQTKRISIPPSPGTSQRLQFQFAGN